MREIKFRGKRIDNGEWTYGYYFRHMDKHKIHVLDGLVSEVYTVDPETVSEFTGKVHNGVKIYEGFILKWEKQETETDEYMSQTDEVVFKDGAFMLRNIEGWCPVYQHFDEYFDNLGDGESVTVIGNVYDNPELVGE